MRKLLEEIKNELVEIVSNITKDTYLIKPISNIFRRIDEVLSKENICDSCSTWDMPEACRYCNRKL